MQKRGSQWLQVGLVTVGLGVVAACGSFGSKESNDDPSADVDGGGGSGEAGVEGGGADGSAASSLVVSLQGGPRVELTRGKRADVVVQVERRNGYVGEVVITTRDLPQGVSAEPLVILAGEKTGTLGLTATATVPHGIATPFVVATARDKSLPPGEAKFDLVLRGLPGTVDESFGKKGIVELPLPAVSFAAMATQANGKLVFAGAGGGTPNVLVGRMLSNGTPDAAFGTGGSRRFSFGSGVDFVTAVLDQPDGKVIVVGTAGAEQKMGLLRLDATGALDTTFGGTGKVLVGSAAPLAAALADDGSIFVMTGNDSYGIVVGRIKPNGTLDTTFGSGGWTTIDKSAFAGSAGLSGSRLALSPTSVLISCIVSGALNQAGVVRVPRNGQGAAVAGKAGSGENTQYQLPFVVRADGRVVLAFNSREGSGAEHTTIFGFASDGKTQDPSFGGGTPIFLPADDLPYGLVEDGAGRLLMAGQVYDSPPTTFRLLRRLPAGGADSAFGVQGLATTAIGDESLATAVAIQKDGRIVVGGNRTSGAVSSPAFVRYWP